MNCVHIWPFESFVLKRPHVKPEYVSRKVSSDSFESKLKAEPSCLLTRK